MQGFIKLHRKMLNWEWYDDINVKVLFLHCLLRANWEDQKWHNQIIPRGSFVTSIAHLAKEVKLTVKQTRLALDKLERTHELGKQTASQYTVISITNWDRWQQEGQTKVTTEGKQRATIEEIKKERINTTILESEKKFNFYGEYTNVFLEQKQYDKLLTMCLSESLLNELINSFSINIEVGKERPYTADLPNAHFERLKSYYNYRKKYPQKFNDEIKRAYKFKFEEQAQTDKVIDQWAEEFDRKYAEME